MLLYLIACLASAPPEPAAEAPTQEQPAGCGPADVLAVEAVGDPGAYMFDVTLRSGDSGCGCYADWWEVLDAEGALLYRRILGHSHVDEQPFTRSGHPVPVQPDQALRVRAHLHPGGYGGQAFGGSVADGFEAIPLEAGFAAEVERAAPQPEGCAF